MTRHFLTLYAVKHLPNALNVAKQLAGYAIVESIVKLMLMKATTQIEYSVREPFQMTKYDKQIEIITFLIETFTMYLVKKVPCTLLSIPLYSINGFKRHIEKIVCVKKDNKLESC